MGNIFVILGIFLMVFACIGFIAGYFLLRKERQELEDYLYNVYGKGENMYEMSEL